MAWLGRGHRPYFAHETEARETSLLHGSWGAISPDFKFTVSAREVASTPLGLGVPEADWATRM